MLPFVVQQEDLSSTSGAAKRRRKNALPRGFFVFEGATNMVSGAFIVTQCTAMENETDVVYWKCERLVLLAKPLVLQAIDIEWKSGMGHLRGEVEVELRMGSALWGHLEQSFHGGRSLVVVVLVMRHSDSPGIVVQWRASRHLHIAREV